MKTTKLFKNGNSQAVRLPKEYRFKGETVYVKKVGNALVILPIDNPWEPLVGSLNQFSEDFMSTREQPKEQEREVFFE